MRRRSYQMPKSSEFQIVMILSLTAIIISTLAFLALRLFA